MKTLNIITILLGILASSSLMLAGHFTRSENSNVQTASLLSIVLGAASLISLVTLRNGIVLSSIAYIVAGAAPMIIMSQAEFFGILPIIVSILIMFSFRKKGAA